MRWRPMKDAPETGELPVLLKAADDIGTAIQGGDGWYFFDIENPENIRYVNSPDGWMPYPKTPGEAQQMLSEAEALAREPQRELAALIARRDAVNREIDALDAAELAERRRAEQRLQDEREQEREQERLRQVRSLLPGGDR